MRDRILALVLLAVSLSCQSLADRVVLMNGDAVTGTVTKLEHGKVFIQSKYMGLVQVDWRAVRSVETAKPVRVNFLHTKVMSRSIEVDERLAEIRTTDKRLLRVPRGVVSSLRSAKEEAAHEKLENPRFTDFWTTSANAGLSASRGNTSTTTLNMGVDAARVTTDRRLLLSFSSLFSVAGASGKTQTTVKAIRSTARYEVNVSDRGYTFALSDFQSDQVQKLDLRSVLGGGVGYRTIQSKKAAFDLFTGASYDHELFSTLPTRESAELLIGQDAEYKFTPKTSIQQRFAMYPNMTNRGDYRTQLDISTTTQLSHWLGWEFTLNNIYVSDPQPGARPNYLLMTTGLRFILGKPRIFSPKLTVTGFPQ